MTTIKQLEVVDGEPPNEITANLCSSLTVGVCTCTNSRCTSWLRTLGDFCYLSHPDLKFRLRNDPYVLAPHGQT